MTFDPSPPLYVGAVPPRFPSPLQCGDKGVAVKLLQEFLSLEGYNLQLDGDFGPATREAVRSKNIRWPSPQTSSLDACWYQQLYDAFGPMTFMGFFGEYKARFSGTLGNRNETGVSYDPKKTEGL